MSGAISSRLTASALADLSVPLPSSAIADEVAALVPRELVAESISEALRSVWRIRDLQRAAAWIRQSSGDVVGIRLADLGMLRSGRIDAKDCFGAPGPERLPVVTARTARGHDEPFRRWASGESPTNDSTVIFTRTAPFRVAHAPTGTLLSKDLLALEVNADASRAPVEVAASVANYFASPEGRRKLSEVATGAVIPHLSLKTLADVCVVPNRILMESATQSSAVESLAERLDATIGRRLAP
ncbi:MAG: hypothetical protein ACRELY_29670 [Polyangiaceae bacterium]